MHEQSVIAALAELERLEQERVDGERRRAAEHKLRAIEREVQGRFDERMQRECRALEARLAGAHAAREALLEQSIAELRAELVAANAARDSLREALTALAQQPAHAGAVPRTSRAPLGVALAALALAAALAGAFGARLIGAPASASPRAGAITTPASPPPVAAPVAPQPAPVTVAAVVPASPTPLTSKPPMPVRRPPSHPHAQRPHPAPVDVLDPIDRCGDDPTCGL